MGARKILLCGRSCLRMSILNQLSLLLSVIVLIGMKYELCKVLNILTYPPEITFYQLKKYDFLTSLKVQL